MQIRVSPKKNTTRTITNEHMVMSVLKKTITELRTVGIIGFHFNGTVGDVDVGNREKILKFIRGIGPQYQFVTSERTIIRWELLDGERWPLERMADDEVIE
ncbi:unnamed protein product [Fraxinus pennsylvanica]|uniref:Uncharacterized protein n=1 Tax=Fraxinus pennsylvanica TaxID=56036 RepID=A0AAD2DLU4_9LAMI|nr:unnamed protein product [Fraxinus pennsylvanica]